MKKWFSASQMSPPSSVPGDLILGIDEKNVDSAGAMAATSPSRLGAPGLVRIALLGCQDGCVFDEGGVGKLRGRGRGW